MNHKQLVMDMEKGAIAQPATDRLTAMARAALLAMLRRADQGYLLLREGGQVIAEIGDAGADVRAEIDIRDPRCYVRALIGGDAAAGEAFVDGWWTTPDLTEVTRFFSRNLAMMDRWGNRFGWLAAPARLLRSLKRLNTHRQAKQNILSHYDVGNDMYALFLDQNMQYSSAVFNDRGESLEQAQLNKLQRICETLQLGPGDHLLEIGSGWGGLAIYAAKNYGCRVTTTTISDAQHQYASAKIRQAGCADRIEVLNLDYRLLEGQYDKIVSVEMIEAVGERYLPGFMDKLNALLKPGGKLLIQAITIADQRFDSYRGREDFIQKHIFPGGFLPSIGLLSKLVAECGDLVIRDILDIGLDYAATLACWRDNFSASADKLSRLGYDRRFQNLWQYYFGYCEGGFLERRISAIQLLASRAPHF